MQCPQCGIHLQELPQLAGKNVSCPQCGFEFVMPSAGGQRGSSQEETDLASIAESARRQFVHAAKRRFKPSTSVLDIFDWKFEKYITPWVVRVTWIAILSLSTLWMMMLIAGLFMSLMPTPTIAPRAVNDPPQQTFHRPQASNEPKAAEPVRQFVVSEEARQYQMRNILAIMGFITAIIMLTIFLLWVRVLLEGVIVIFHVSETLSMIDRRIANAANSA